MTNIDYVQNYFKSINKLNADLEKKATDAIKEFGKEIDIFGIKAHDLNLDRDDDEVWDAVLSDCEFANVETKYGNIYECAILGVRYNKETNKIEALMYDCQWESVNEWIDIDYLYRDTQISVYVTILDYIDHAKEINS